MPCALVVSGTSPESKTPVTSGVISKVEQLSAALADQAFVAAENGGALVGLVGILLISFIARRSAPAPGYNLPRRERTTMDSVEDAGWQAEPASHSKTSGAGFQPANRFSERYHRQVCVSTPNILLSIPNSTASTSTSLRRWKRRSHKSKIREGMILVSAMHITAGVWVNDAEDGLLADIDEWLERLAPLSRRLPPSPHRRDQWRFPPEKPAGPPPGDRARDRREAGFRPLAAGLLRRIRRPAAQTRHY